MNIRLASLLHSLDGVALDAAALQIKSSHTLEEKMDAPADAFLASQAWPQASAAQLHQRLQNKKIRDKRDMRRAGRAADVLGLALLAGGDPLDISDAWQVVAARQRRGPGAATVDGEPALSIAETAQRCRRSGRAVQCAMQLLCRAEAAGQGVIPGLPPAASVFTTRRTLEEA